MKSKNYLVLLCLLGLALASCTGNAALIKASEEGDIFKAETSIAQGANVNSRDRLGNTALHYAVARNHDPIIMLLAEYGADLNIPNSQGNTVLHTLLIENQAEEKTKNTLIQYFLGKRADINYQNNEGKSPFQLVLESKNWALLNQFFSFEQEPLLNFTLDRGDFKNITPLTFVMLEGKWDLAVFFLGKTPDINQIDGSGFNPLHLSLILGKLDFLQLTLEKGADINQKTIQGWTVLDLVLQSEKLTPGQKLEQAKKFLAYAVNPDNTDSENIPTLYWALRFADDKLLELLLSQENLLKEEYFNLSNPKNILPLLTKRKQTKFLNQFLNNLVISDENRFKFNGLALNLALAGNIEALKILSGKGLPLHQQKTLERISLLHAALINKNNPVILYLLNNGEFDLSQTIHHNSKMGYAGMAPLHLAILSENLESLNLLLKKNASIEQKVDSGPYQGKTPLELAELTKNRAIIRAIKNKMK